MLCQCLMSLVSMTSAWRVGGPASWTDGSPPSLPPLPLRRAAPGERHPVTGQVRLVGEAAAHRHLDQRHPVTHQRVAALEPRQPSPLLRADPGLGPHQVAEVATAEADLGGHLRAPARRGSAGPGHGRPRPAARGRRAGPGRRPAPGRPGPPRPSGSASERRSGRSRRTGSTSATSTIAPASPAAGVPSSARAPAIVSARNTPRWRRPWWIAAGAGVQPRHVGPGPVRAPTRRPSPTSSGSSTGSTSVSVVDGIPMCTPGSPTHVVGRQAWRRTAPARAARSWSETASAQAAEQPDDLVGAPYVAEGRGRRRAGWRVGPRRGGPRRRRRPARPGSRSSPPRARGLDAHVGDRAGDDDGVDARGPAAARAGRRRPGRTHPTTASRPARRRRLDVELVPQPLAQRSPPPEPANSSATRRRRTPAATADGCAHGRHHPGHRAAGGAHRAGQPVDLGHDAAARSRSARRRTA